MAEGTYEYECARAELLGMREPSIDEFNAAQEARQLDDAGTVSIIDSGDSWKLLKSRII